MKRVVDTLFPTHPIAKDFTLELKEEVPKFTEEDLKIAINSMKNKKAPGPDGIPVIALKLVAENNTDLLLNIFNCCLKEGIFPKTWKKQRLVLISKGKGDSSSPSAYRPLCMLSTAGKLLERLIKPRLTEAVKRAGDLSHRQYGFRKGRSTIDGVQEVIKTFERAQMGNHFSRKIVLLATFDVRNAFNSQSARWSDRRKALREDFKIPEYLLNILNSYLKDRVLLYDTTDGKCRKRVTAGQLRD